MTHSLHREGTVASLERDYAVFIYPARGFNYEGCAPKIQHLVEIVGHFTSLFPDPTQAHIDFCIGPP